MDQLSYPYFVGTLLKPHKELMLISHWPKVSYVVSYFQVRMGNDFFCVFLSTLPPFHSNRAVS